MVRLWRAVRSIAVYSLGFGLMGLVIWLGGGNKTVEDLLLLDLRFVALGFVATVGISLTAAMRWGMLARSLSGNSSAQWRHYFAYYVINRFLSFILPEYIADLGGRSLALARHDVSAAVSFGSVLLDRLFDLFSICLFLPICLCFVMNWLSVDQSLALLAIESVILLVGGVLAGGRLSGLLDSLLRTVSAGAARLPVLGKYVGRSGLHELSFQRLTLRTLSLAYVLTVVKYGLGSIRYIFLAAAVSATIPAAVIFLTMPLPYLSLLFTVTPGGLGVFEGSWLAVFALLDISADQSGPFLVAQRVLVVFYSLILAAPVVAVYVVRKLSRSPLKT